MSTLPRHCKEKRDRQPSPSAATDPFQGRSILAPISMANDGKMYTDFQGLDLMDSPHQFDVQDHHPTDQQPPGQMQVEPI